MTRKDIAARVAGKLDLEQNTAYQAVQIILAELEAALKRGEKIELRGFGSFRPHLRRARAGRNPRTGVSVQVPAKRVVRFKPGWLLLDLLNNKPPIDRS